MPTNYLRLLTSITTAHCERTGLPVPKHDLTDAEREEGHAALDDAEDMSLEERRRIEADERAATGLNRVAPWDR